MHTATVTSRPPGMRVCGCAIRRRPAIAKKNPYSVAIRKMPLPPKFSQPSVISQPIAAMTSIAPK